MIFKLRNYFLTGLLVLTPIALTVWLFWQIFHGIDKIVLGILNSLLTLVGIAPYQGKIPGLGIAVMIVLILTTGLVARNYLGRKMIRMGNWLIKQIPLFSKLYNTFQQLFTAILSEKRAVFKQVVLFEYPRRGIYSFGFITQKTGGEIKDRTGKDLLGIFLPTTPNPTTGYLIFVPQAEVVYLKMTVEEAIKLILSGGAIGINRKELTE